MTDKSRQRSNEAILLTLDQLSQTIDVMTSVVGRLKAHLQEQDGGGHESAEEEDPPRSAAASSATIH
ncbi:MAG: hypothetical protein OXC05_16205 [Halieaceae bacterium]|nr:hypothetical protein [Halieaceae bacterium]